MPNTRALTNTPSIAWNFATAGEAKADIQVVDPRTNATNALTEGATGDGVTDDTAAIETSVATALADDSNLWNGYHVLYFPAGTYLVGNPVISGATKLFLVGDGMMNSVFKQSSANILGINTCSWIRIRNMGFDANNIDNFGGVRVNASDHVDIAHCRFFDSNPRGLGDTNPDRYAAVWAYDGVQSTDCYFGYNLIEDLQCEFDHIARFMIEHNVSLRAATTCALGTFGVGAGCLAHDVTYRFNKIYGVRQYAIAIKKDNTSANMEFKRISVYGNEIHYTHTAQTAIRLGISTAGVTQNTDLFEDIDVSANTIIYEPTCPDGIDSDAVIQFLPPTSGFGFDRCTVSSNRIYANWRGGYWAIEVRRFRNGRIENNVIRQPLFVGIIMTSGCSGNSVQYNQIESRSKVLSISSSGGDNILSNNQYFGIPSVLVETDGAATGDVFDDPTPSRGFGQSAYATDTWDPGSIADGATATTTIAVPGIDEFTVLSVSFSSITTSGWFLSAAKTATDTATVTLLNKTGGPVDLGSGTLVVKVDYNF